MLKKLRIKNYVLINELDVAFTDGLSIITGETGAGKSIILGALGLVLGDRADAKTLSDKNKKCIIEAEFAIADYGLKSFFADNDLDFENNTIIRREISVEGKSRAFINDTPVNLALLKELSNRLVDVHSQHQTLTVNSSSFQLTVVDAFAAHVAKLDSYKSKYIQYRSLQKQLQELVEKENKSKAEFDFLQFQFDELENANLQPNEKETVEQELQLLSNTESIIQSLSGVNILLNDGDANAVQVLTQAATALQQVAKYHESLGELAKRIQGCKVELKDISDEINGLQNQFHVNPSRIEIINERLNIYNRLEQKHRVGSSEELIQVKNSISDKLLDYSSIATDIEKTQYQLSNLETELNKLADELSANRKKASVKLQKEMHKLLTEVVLPDAKFEVEINAAEDFTPSGKDYIRFLFSANKGTPLQELGKVASGGELSRLMLCIKTLMADLVAMPTIIFDEIDTGISGEVAFKVGNMIEKLAHKRQVIAITHLPQMASKGKTHYFVFKKEEKGVTQSSIKVLNKEERVVEIAKMLSGELVTGASMENAKDLLLR